MKLRWPTLWARASTRHSIDQPDAQSPLDDSLPHELRWRVEAAQRQKAHRRARLEARFGPAASWPRLSQTLTGPKHPHVCQSCGVEAQPPTDESTLPATFASTDSATIMNQVIDERRRELFLQSQRFYDINRFNLPLIPAPGVSYGYKGGFYGDMRCFPLPDVERQNNPTLAGK